MVYDSGSRWSRLRQKVNEELQIVLRRGAAYPDVYVSDAKEGLIKVCRMWAFKKMASEERTLGKERIRRTLLQPGWRTAEPLLLVNKSIGLRSPGGRGTANHGTGRSVRPQHAGHVSHGE